MTLDMFVTLEETMRELYISPRKVGRPWRRNRRPWRKSGRLSEGSESLKKIKEPLRRRECRNSGKWIVDFG